MCDRIGAAGRVELVRTDVEFGGMDGYALLFGPVNMAARHTEKREPALTRVKYRLVNLKVAFWPALRRASWTQSSLANSFTNFIRN